MFKFENIENFDEHIHNSIPNYDGLLDIIVPICNEYLGLDGNIVDLGCSRGTTLEKISTKGEKIGVDIIDMGNKNVRIVKSDVLDYLEYLTFTPDVILCIFTLQFLGNKKRELVIKELSNLRKAGSKIIIAEKVYLPDVRVNNILNRVHIQKKRSKFKDSEILDKDDQLFGSMFPKPESEIAIELQTIGTPIQIWQSYNFKAWFIK